jgi:hypothetical protein
LALPLRDLVRGVTAMGFSGFMLDRFAYPDNAAVQMQELGALLGTPIATRSDRLVAWDLRPVTGSLLGNLSATARRALARAMLDAPRIYLATDVETITSRGTGHVICDAGSLSLVNPGPRPVRQDLQITFTQRRSSAQHGHVTINHRNAPFLAGHVDTIAVTLPHGTTTIPISVDTPEVRCASVPRDSLPAISASLVPLPSSI